MNLFWKMFVSIDSLKPSLGSYDTHTKYVCMIAFIFEMHVRYLNKYG